MSKVNINVYKDKVYACFMGKNIGGTIGAPYEGKRELLDIKGLISEPGKPLPNDDLDLQLVWLKAVQENNLRDLNPALLGEYWLDRIIPDFNEYGIAKANLKNGILPPMSGELNNPYWKDSNGAWIRTEIWACLAPGAPFKACRCSCYDAMVDHGHGEGTTAAIFIAALESAAFVVDDLRELINIGLKKIPSDSRVAQSVRLAAECYDSGLDWKTAREKIVADSEDLGWFMAPANIGFVVIGLLYGEGDFKKTVLTAVNCGDDTDCTGATAGAIMGIMHGTAGLPEDWCRHIGNEIVTSCIDHFYWGGHGGFPDTIEKLTDQITETLKKQQVSYLTDEEITGENKPLTDVFAPDWDYESELKNFSPYSFTLRNRNFHATVDLGREPKISALGEIDFRMALRADRYTGIVRSVNVRWLVPDGYKVVGDGTLIVGEAISSRDDRELTAVGKYKLISPETPLAKATVIAEITATGVATPLYLPITVFSK